MSGKIRELRQEGISHMGADPNLFQKSEEL
jgi:hypothetical protein